MDDESTDRLDYFLLISYLQRSDINYRFGSLHPNVTTPLAMLTRHNRSFYTIAMPTADR